MFDSAKQKPRIILSGGRWLAGVKWKKHRHDTLIMPSGGMGMGSTPMEAYCDWYANSLLRGKRFG